MNFFIDRVKSGGAPVHVVPNTQKGTAAHPSENESCWLSRLVSVKRNYSDLLSCYNQEERIERISFASHRHKEPEV